MTFNVGVYGATGQVGGVMRRVLQERRFPVGRLRLFASARSAGQVLDGVVVEDVAAADHRGTDIALFSMGAAASTAVGAGGGAGAGPSSSTTPRPGAWTPMCPWWCRR